MITNDEVQETFYNAMIDTMITGIIAGYNPEYVKNTLSCPVRNEEFIKDIIVETFTNVLKTAKIVKLSNDDKSIKISSVRGNTITSETVSQTYKDLFNSLTNIFFTGNYGFLYKIAEEVMKLESFKIIIKNVIKFYLESTKTVTEKAGLINADTIRETFYNIMVEQYYLNKSVTKEDIEAQEAHIFIAMSVYTIFAVARYNKSISGIKLCNNAVVNLNNCPNIFKDLFAIMLEIKDGANRLHLTSEEEKYILETASLKQQNNTDNLNIRSEVKQLTSKFSEVSIKISQIPHFKEVIGHVFDFILAC